MNNLFKALGLLTELHRSLLETAKRKQEILVSGDANQLLPVISEESRLLKKIKQADEERIQTLGKGNATLSLSQLVEQQPDGDIKDELRFLSSTLKNLFQEIGQVNQLNQQLLQQSLTYTQNMIEQILPITNGPGTYSAGAASKESSDSIRLFDAKA